MDRYTGDLVEGLQRHTKESGARRRVGADAETTAAIRLGEGRNGVSTHGVAANFMSFDRGTFWELPLTYFYIPKSARA